MSLSVDQQIQMWNTVGTWFAGLATFAAVLFSLAVLRRGEKVRLRTTVGMRMLVGGSGPIEEVVMISITNLADRAVTVVNVSWKVGKGEHIRYAVQTFTNRSPERPPVTIQHGQTATFTLDIEDNPSVDVWLQSMVSLGEGRQLKQWDTLTFQVHTSVGQDVVCRPETALIERIKNAQGQNA